MGMTSRRDESVAVVTGGASGIGLRTCELFLDEGMTVVGLDLNKVPAALSGRHRFLEITADVSDVREVARRASVFGTC